MSHKWIGRIDVDFGRTPVPVADRGLGCPSAIRVDNGPEFTAQPFVDWCADHPVTILYIEPGTPDQNAYAERFVRGQ